MTENKQLAKATREEVLSALSAIGEDPDGSRVERVWAQLAKVDLPPGEREKEIRLAVEDARRVLDAAPERSRTPLLLGAHDDTWKLGDTVDFGRDSELRAVVLPGLYRYSGLGMGCYFSLSGRIDWLDQSEAHSQAQREGVRFVYWDADSTLVPLAYSTAGLWDVSKGEQGRPNNPEVAVTDVHKTVIQYTVLHDFEVDFASMSLREIAQECDDGQYLGGGLTIVSSAPLAREQVEQEAAMIGSEAAFFDLDGNEEASCSSMEP
ncbi:hypothetical protein [Ralstonia sp. ASV6]|uniref:hypothetical protein n=1 Tax=Ralstonia sp. ASV6 TaxID=2795124 RepID=UPI0018EC83B5|nr:hypothetical protein [Ralstonia sp. ASV6]